MGGETPRLRVLLVEDSPDDAELLLLELRRQGFECDSRQVDTRAAMAEALQDDAWDVIISDFQMPAFDGLAAFQLYKDSGLDTPFIFVSGVLGEEGAVEAMRAGARDYILKGHLGRLGVSVLRELSASRDRREKRESRTASLREQHRLAMAVEATGSGIFEHDVPFTGVHLSPTCNEILGCGLDASGPVDLTWVRERVHPDDWDPLAHAYRRLLRGQDQRISYSVRARHAGGEWLDLVIDAKVVERDAAGAAARVVGALRNMTVQHRLQKQLQASQKMEAVGRLAGGLAHDLNNILTVIYAFGGLVQEGLSPDAACRADVEQILQAAKKASHLTSQLLASSRKQPQHPRSIPINRLLTTLDHMLARILGDDIEHVLDLAPDAGCVYADPDSLEQVVLNIALNARDAMPEGGRLTLGTTRLTVTEATPNGPAPGEYVKVSLTDTGTGMDAATLEHIFEPFFTTKGPDHGTGLGLSMCYGIITQANGHIRARSRPGAGTTLELLLPASEPGTCVDATGGAIRSIAPLPRPGGHEHVLLVEDDGQLRATMERALASLGYRLTVAACARDALTWRRSKARSTS